MDIDIPIVAVIYGLIVIIFGSYLVMNLILAVIIDTFIKIQQGEMSKEMRGDAFDPILIFVDDKEVNVAQYDILLDEVEKAEMAKNEAKLKKRKERKAQRQELERLQNMDMKSKIEEIDRRKSESKVGGLG